MALREGFKAPKNVEEPRRDFLRKQYRELQLNERFDALDLQHQKDLENATGTLSGDAVLRLQAHGDLTILKERVQKKLRSRKAPEAEALKEMETDIAHMDQLLSEQHLEVGTAYEDYGEKRAPARKREASRSASPEETPQLATKPEEREVIIQNEELGRLKEEIDIRGTEYLTLYARFNGWDRRRMEPVARELLNTTKGELVAKEREFVDAYLVHMKEQYPGRSYQVQAESFLEAMRAYRNDLEAKLFVESPPSPEELEMHQALEAGAAVSRARELSPERRGKLAHAVAAMFVAGAALTAYEASSASAPASEPAHVERVVGPSPLDLITLAQASAEEPVPVAAPEAPLSVPNVTLLEPLPEEPRVPLAELEGRPTPELL